MGIHYTRRAFEGQIKMEKQARKEKRRLEKLAKKNAKAQEKGLVENKEQDDTIPLDTVITLDLLTSNKNSDKK
jgi:hypothetical protein|tara:strand:+ start:919 stop:1137 length:219 start_codon:yes stop_codon:yes gene_type:complete